MKKFIILSLISLVTFVPQLCSISLEQYFQENGGIPGSAYFGQLLLSDRKITDITGLRKISTIEHMTSIILSYNQLQELPANIFSDLNKLIKLDLSSNQLKTLPENIFSGLRKLSQLCLCDNPLQELPVGIFNDLNNLQYLNLSIGNFSASFIPRLIELIHNIPNDKVEISFRDLGFGAMPKYKAIKRLARLVNSHLLRNLPSDIREYYNIEPLE